MVEAACPPSRDNRSWNGLVVRQVSRAWDSRTRHAAQPIDPLSALAVAGKASWTKMLGAAAPIPHATPCLMETRPPGLSVGRSSRRNRHGRLDLRHRKPALRRANQLERRTRRWLRRFPARTRRCRLRCMLLGRRFGRTIVAALAQGASSVPVRGSPALRRCMHDQRRRDRRRLAFVERPRGDAAVSQHDLPAGGVRNRPPGTRSAGRERRESHARAGPRMGVAHASPGIPRESAKEFPSARVAAKQPANGAAQCSSITWPRGELLQKFRLV